VLTADNGQLRVVWDTHPLAERYEVWIGTADSIFGAGKKAEARDGVNSAVIGGLENGTRYYIWIKAVNNAGTSQPSPSASGMPDAFTQIPPAPAAPVLTTGDGEIAVSWQALATASSYTLWYGADSNPANAERYAAGLTGTSAVISGLENGQTYHVWVQGWNRKGDGPRSPAASAKAGLPGGSPAAPSVTIGPGKLILSWDAVPGAAEYEVYYGTDTADTLFTTVSGTTATVTGLVNGTNYKVRLRAKNRVGVSDFGPETSGTPMPPSVKLYQGGTGEAQKIGEYTLTGAAAWLSANAADGHAYYLVMVADDTAAPIEFSWPNKTVGVTLMTDGPERTIQLGSNGSLFTVNSGVTLTLEDNVTLKGIASNTVSLVSIQRSGTFTMNGGEISGNTASYYYGGGGGGVYLYGTFTMSGGKISGNTASHGGGVYVSYSGTFTMSGGEISGNTASYNGGVSVEGRFTMSGGEISGNTASRGGGVSVSHGTFTMSGGEISGNTASFYGGGVDVSGGTFTMSGGEISGNTTSTYSSCGGGVYAISGTFTKASTGGLITGYGNNTTTGNKVVQNGQGHAVYVSSSKRLEKTVPADKALDSRVDGAGGGWTE
jgi:hypothetical protein